MSIQSLNPIITQIKQSTLDASKSFMCVSLAQLALSLTKKESGFRGVLSPVCCVLIPALLFKPKSVSYTKFLKNHPLLIGAIILQMASRMKIVRAMVKKALNPMRVSMEWINRIEFIVPRTLRSDYDRSSFRASVINSTLIEGVFFRIILQLMILRLLLKLPAQLTTAILSGALYGIISMPSLIKRTDVEAQSSIKLTAVLETVSRGFIMSYLQEYFGLLPSIVSDYGHHLDQHRGDQW